MCKLSFLILKSNETYTFICAQGGVLLDGKVGGLKLNATSRSMKLFILNQEKLVSFLPPPVSLLVSLHTSFAFKNWSIKNLFTPIWELRIRCHYSDEIVILRTMLHLSHFLDIYLGKNWIPWVSNNIFNQTWFFF